MNWITLKTTSSLWEAEMMQQMLEAHGIPARVLSRGLQPHFGCGAPAVLEVRSRDQWTALLLLSPLEEEATEGSFGG
ncbi:MULTISPECIES: DUF2007 domain-containing protein [unclassified Leptolyngbya]|uniref:DUF2007 domain-containing protein n=1 Tax=unclassified Leptolyngbya TaxID=2650499 RepID=UPI0016842A16|nr:DUF2007 domain-containing protein [Leptolyngbya sp. FACHB-8]MBD2154261.1 DUF2007 domain-containing protein [Leptolyngbya sp. FACHB-16]